MTVSSATAMSRLGTRVAGAVMTLCAPGAGWVTGAVATNSSDNPGQQEKQP